jgi:hypothetical protein
MVPTAKMMLAMALPKTRKKPLRAALSAALASSPSPPIKLLLLWMALLFVFSITGDCGKDNC